MACTDCRRARKSGARYCPRCGEPLGSEAVPLHSRTPIAEAPPDDKTSELLHAEISARLIRCPAARIDDSITEAISQVGRFLEVDSIGLLLLTEKRDSLDLTHRWLSDTTKPNFPIGHSLRSSMVPWLHHQLKSGVTVVVHDLADIPPEAKEERDIFRFEGTASSMLVPVGPPDRPIGGLYLQIRQEGKRCSSDDEILLRSLGTSIAFALERKRTEQAREQTLEQRTKALLQNRELEEALAHSLAFERLAAEISARFINVPIDQLDASIEDALGRLGLFLGVDSITVRVLDEAGSALTLTHRWRRDGSLSRYDFGHKLLLKHIPWLYARLQADEVVQISDSAEIPPEAENERMLFAYLGQTSSMAVPLHQTSGLIGMQYFTMRNEKKIWSSDDESLLRFLGVSISNALERKQAGLALEKTIRTRTDALSTSLERMEKLNRVLTRANAARDRFLATMSHELRTPMNAVLGYADMLAGLYYGHLNEKQKTHVAAITTSGTRLLALLDNLLDANKIDSGEIELQRESIAIADLLEAPAAMLRAQAEKRGVELTVEPTPDLPMLICDPNRANQMLLNLLDNALKYTAEGGHVTLRARREDAHVRIEVSDTGIGITPEHQATIFEEFEQADRERDEGLGGIGMGLPLCKRLVQLHGGRIGLISTAGAGSTFWFTLPLAEDAPVATAGALPAADAERRSVAPTGKLILVAEDNETNLGMILDMLEALGARGLGVPNGLAALEMTQKMRPDLILMDVRMPVMDGLEATRRIHALPGCAEIPVVALTANAGPEYQTECLAAGCQGFLSKPIQMATLDTELKRFLESAAGS